ncbi:hypothetical protein PV703_24730 [Streptomyces sp. ME01-24h]|nr:hypothetical protein [Streptomyces sp. ME19-03-3]MDX3356456.1 hypothetical protein [Streptomyces sp. ME01-24h]
MRAHTFTSVLVPVLLVGLAACGGSAQPSDAGGAPTTPTPSSTPTVIVPESLPMPDLIGGNVQGAIEQMGPDTRVKVTDATGQHRPVEDPSTWKICTAVRNPEQVVVLGAVWTSERC